MCEQKFKMRPEFEWPIIYLQVLNVPTTGMLRFTRLDWLDFRIRLFLVIKLSWQVSRFLFSNNSSKTTFLLYISVDLVNHIVQHCIVRNPPPGHFTHWKQKSIISLSSAHFFKWSCIWNVSHIRSKLAYLTRQSPVWWTWSDSCLSQQVPW